MSKSKVARPTAATARPNCIAQTPNINKNGDKKMAINGSDPRTPNDTTYMKAQDSLTDDEVYSKVQRAVLGDISDDLNRVLEWLSDPVRLKGEPEGMKESSINAITSLICYMAAVLAQSTALDSIENLRSKFRYEAA